MCLEGYTVSTYDGHGRHHYTRVFYCSLYCLHSATATPEDDQAPVDGQVITAVPVDELDQVDGECVVFD